MCSCVSIRVGWLLSGALFDLPFIYESLGSQYCPAGAKTPPRAHAAPRPARTARPPAAISEIKGNSLFGAYSTSSARTEESAGRPLMLSEVFAGSRVFTSHTLATRCAVASGACRHRRGSLSVSAAAAAVAAASARRLGQAARRSLRLRHRERHRERPALLRAPNTMPKSWAILSTTCCLASS